ncbi:MAG: acetyl-CoA C-acetyltransferase [Bacteriovoracaceae bacterium]|nr:acetyl-CoA C-acetyltransferase [Bacteriovoracaceae bacterium]
MESVKRVCIVGGARIPFCRSQSAYKGLSNLDLMGTALRGLVDKFNLKGKEVGEVALGAVNKHSYHFALARESVMESGLSPKTPATDMQKACGTSLETSIFIANKIALGQIECGIAGGVDTNSDLPIEFKKASSDRLLSLNSAKTFKDKVQAFKGFNPKELMPTLPSIKEPRTGLSMGESCEVMAKTWKITRLEQDQLAFESHQKAESAYEKGFYDDLLIPHRGLKKDALVRGDTTMEKMGKLRACFDRTESGTLTAANSSPLTDGASCTFYCSEDYAKEHGLEVLAYLGHVQSFAVDYLGDEGLLMAPAYAVSKLLEKAGLGLADFDFYEIHEAFAAQVLCTMKSWNDSTFCKEKLGRENVLGTIDRDKLNVNGGSVALGHPFAATGTRIVASLAKMLKQKGSGKALISICTAGGMGVTAIVYRD